MAPTKQSLADKVEGVLRASGEYMTIEEICRASAGRIDDRTRNNVHLVLHRLNERGTVEKQVVRYRFRKAD